MGWQDEQVAVAVERVYRRSRWVR